MVIEAPGSPDKSRWIGINRKGKYARCCSSTIGGFDKPVKDASVRKADARGDYLKNTQSIVFETATSKLKIASHT